MTPTWLLRRSAAPEPGTVDETAPGTDAEDAPAEPEAAEPESPATRPPNGRLRTAVLAGTAVVLVLGGCGFFYGAHQLRSQAPARNQALTDAEATSRVAGDVGNALARIFSYTPDAPRPPNAPRAPSSTAAPPASTRPSSPGSATTSPSSASP